MKKKIFLGLLSTSMLLTGCNLYTNKEHIKENVTFNETTDIDDDAFLNAEINFANSFDPIADDEPAIGIQTKVDSGLTTIRFIAAIKVVDKNNDGVVNNVDLGLTNVSFGRALYYGSGTNKGNAIKELDYFPCKKAYVALNASGTRYTVDQYNIDHGTSFSHFVTYVLKDIPSSYNDAFLNVYADVEDGPVSKIVSTVVNQSTQFAFDTTEDGVFGILKDQTGKHVFHKKYKPYYSTVRYTFEYGFTATGNESFALINFANDWSKFYVYGINELANNSYVGGTQDGSTCFVKPNANKDLLVLLDNYSSIIISNAHAVNIYLNPGDWPTLNNGHVFFQININYNLVKGSYSDQSENLSFPITADNEGKYAIKVYLSTDLLDIIFLSAHCINSDKPDLLVTGSFDGGSESLWMYFESFTADVPSSEWTHEWVPEEY